MKISFAHNDRCFFFFDSLHLIGPFAAQFNGSLNGFNTGIHWQNLIVIEKLSDEPGIFRKPIVVEGATGKC